MGLQKNKAFFLAKLIQDHQIKSVCMMGKQSILMNWKSLESNLERFHLTCKPEVMKTMEATDEIDSYFFFRLFGVEKVCAVDYSDYEGADILVDLNLKDAIPREHRGQFDLVVDGGTLEHIYDQGNAMNNMDSLVKVRGYIFHAVPCAGYVEHGYYSYSPSLFVDHYSTGYDLKNVYIEIYQKLNGQEKGVYVCSEDCRLMGGAQSENTFISQNMHGVNSNALVVSLAQKLEEKKLSNQIYQDQWVKEWEDGKNGK